MSVTRLIERSSTFPALLVDAKERSKELLLLVKDLPTDQGGDEGGDEGGGGAGQGDAGGGACLKNCNNN